MIYRSAWMTVSTLVASAVLAAACSGAPVPGAEPHDMSAAEHREHAKAETAEAAKHEKRYDPNATEAVPIRGPEDWDFAEGVYNPTRVHLEHAREHRAHAAAHAAAAAKLDSYVEHECGRFPPATRKLCPLLGQVDSTADIDGGVRLHFAEGVNVEAALAHVRCHLAFAAEQGYKGMDSCPLYLKDVTSKPGADGHSVELLESDPALLGELKKRSADHVAP